MKIYVGNLPFGSTDEELGELFTDFGDVDSASIVVDKETGESRGFGFVEMQEKAAARDAIQALNGSPMNGRTIEVRQAQKRQPRHRSRQRRPQQSAN